MFGIKWNNNKNIVPVDRRGFTMVEIIMVVAVITLALTAVLAFLSFDSRVAEKSRTRLAALTMAQEAVEAVRNFRDNTDWTTGVGVLNIDTNYYPVNNASGWSIVQGSETLNGFNRAIVFSRVSRDANDNIENIYNPANNDPNTRRIKVIVDWIDRQGPASESLTTYLTNWRK